MRFQSNRFWTDGCAAIIVSETASIDKPSFGSNVRITDLAESMRKLHVIDQRLHQLAPPPPIFGLIHHPIRLNGVARPEHDDILGRLKLSRDFRAEMGAR
jgi:hypothetical protein